MASFLVNGMSLSEALGSGCDDPIPMSLAISDLFKLWFGDLLSAG